MKLLVTGSNGFIAKNLLAELRHHPEHEVLEINRQTSEEDMDRMVQQADFIFHLAGVNRPDNEADFMAGNYGLTFLLLEKLKAFNNIIPILMTSSVQAELDNPYGKSKLASEELLKEYSKRYQVMTYIYRLQNVFGKWSRPNYNSVVATFCHKIARNEAIEIHNPNSQLNLVYIDEIVQEFLNCINKEDSGQRDYEIIQEEYQIKVGELAELLASFKQSRSNLMIPNMSDPLIKRLYSTYLSYLPENQFGYPLVMHQDSRGYFTEFIKSPEGGQVSINRSKPGITKGDHWHHTKNEKFLVVFGKGLIRFRGINQDEIIEYPVSDEKLEVIDIPVGYTHSIVNTGDMDMVTVMWVNELFDSQKPDTFSLEVES